MKKEIRQIIYKKYNGLCAYTGKKLLDDWQVDHKISVRKAKYLKDKFDINVDYNSIENLMPVNRIINHYKRAFDLEGFRTYMLDFHIRLSKMQKKTNSIKTKNRINYMNTIAQAFNITVNKQFTGKFYFETI